MSTEVLSGIDGKVLVGTSEIANITKFNIKKSIGLGEYKSSSTSGHVKHTKGAKSWEGSCDFLCDGDLPDNMPEEGDDFTGHFITTTGKGWTGPASVETIDITSEVGESPVSGSMTFKCQGPLEAETST